MAGSVTRPPHAFRTAALLLAGLAAAALAADVLLSGAKLHITDNARHAARRKVVFLSKDPAIDLTGVDPTTTGAAIEVANPNAGHEQSAVFELPAGSWSKLHGKIAGFHYKDAKRTHGPVTAMTIKAGKRITFAASGTQEAFALGGQMQGSVRVTVDVRPTRYCTLFGGTVKKDTGAAFVAVGAPAPAACPTSTTTLVTSGTTTTTLDVGASVLQLHRTANRAGVYVDNLIDGTAAAAMHLDPGFSAITNGETYAQPLFLDRGGADDLLFVATEENWVYALNANTGAQVWSRQLAPSVPLADLPCGDIDPLGVTGTPVFDVASGTLFLDAMTTPDGGTTLKHLIYGLSVDDGSDRAAPVDVTAALAGIGMTFDSSVQNERGGLVIFGDTVYVPYGGHAGDCGPHGGPATYHGWVVGVSLATPRTVHAWSTVGVGGGAWAPGGLAADASGVYVATGNTFGVTTWSGGEAIIRLFAGPVFSGNAADYFAPHDWHNLDNGDVDIGGSGPIAFDVPGATPSQLLVALGKNGKAYLIDRGNLGGITPADGVAHAQVAGNEIINAAVAYHTATSTYVAFKGNGSSCPGPAPPGDLTALAIGAASPPTIMTAWCANNFGRGSPMVTTKDGTTNVVVWTVGAEGDNRLHGYDGDLGTVVFPGGGAGDVMTGGLSRYVTPIAAKGRIFVAGTNAVYAFTSH
jgi:hypothetical protein